MDILAKIDGLEARFHEVSLQITDPAVIADQPRYVKLNRDYHELERVLTAAEHYRKVARQLADAKEIFYNESDTELKEMARAEIEELEPQIGELEEQVKILLSIVLLLRDMDIQNITNSDIEIAKVCMQLGENNEAEGFLYMLQNKNAEYRKEEVESLLAGIVQ